MGTQFVADKMSFFYRNSFSLIDGGQFKFVGNSMSIP